MLVLIGGLACLARLVATAVAAPGARTGITIQMALYETQIEAILSTDENTKDIFLGAFARDELPAEPGYPSCFIVNTDPRSAAGGHWLALHYNKAGVCSFFDSYAYPPSFYRLESYCQRTSVHWSYNQTRIQGVSEYCGYFACLFLLFKARNREREFYNQFKKDLDFNDKIIYKFIQ